MKHLGGTLLYICNCTDCYTVAAGWSGK